VLVHVGFAISIVDREEAARTLELLRELAEVSEGACSTSTNTGMQTSSARSPMRSAAPRRSRT
jgi:hypothetical protein